MASHPLDTELAESLSPAGCGTQGGLIARRLADYQSSLAGPEARSSDWQRCGTAPVQPGGPDVGDLCITRQRGGEDPGIMVLVRARVGETAVVVPVVHDVEIADDECAVVPYALSPTGFPVSVYRTLRASVPAEAIDRKVIPLEGSGGLLEALDHPRSYAGPPIEDAADPRLEVRQWLIECMLACWPDRRSQAQVIP